MRRIRTVLIVGGDAPSRERLGRDFVALGHEVWAVADLAEAEALMDRRLPDLVVCDDDLHRPWKRVLRRLRQVDAGGHVDLSTAVAVVTAYPSLSSAVLSMHAGAAAYFSKPVDARQLLEALEPAASPPANTPPEMPTLSRLQWEYLNRVLDDAGSIAEAARRLGVERRSLRRTLRKYPPTR